MSHVGGKGECDQTYKDPSQIQTFVKCLEFHCPGRGHSQHRCSDALLFLSDQQDSSQCFFPPCTARPVQAGRWAEQYQAPDGKSSDPGSWGGQSGSQAIVGWFPFLLVGWPGPVHCVSCPELPAIWRDLHLLELSPGCREFCDCSVGQSRHLSWEFSVPVLT